MKILFLDRGYHQATKSSNFFQALLETYFDVDLRYVDGVLVDELLDGHSPHETLVVLWQCEILAPLIRERKFACLLVPMWDGVSTLGENYWQILSGLPALSFCYTMHHSQMCNHGIKSFYAQFAPDPADFPQVENYDEPRFFFWHRGDFAAIDSFSVARLALGYGAHLTVHQDDKKFENAISHIANYKEPNRTEWFDSKADLLASLASHNVYFAPRLNEGIGFGFLDAMACGMVVLSHNGPTMNEYIKHRINGLLFENLLDPLAETKIYDNPSELQKMGLAARETIRRANQHWRQQEGQILDFLKVVFDQTSNQCGSKDIPDSLMNNLRYCLVDIDDFIRLANQ